MPLWLDIIFHVHTDDIDYVKENYHLIEDKEDTLQSAIMCSSMKVVDYLISQGVTGYSVTIEACAIISHDIEMVKYLIAKGYPFDSRDTLDTIVEYTNKARCSNNHNEMYELVAKRVLLREIMNEGYLSWLFTPLCESLFK